MTWSFEDTDKVEYFNVKKILQWQWILKIWRRRQEFLALWQEYLVEEAEWIPASLFSDEDALQEDIQTSRIPEEQ